MTKPTRSLLIPAAALAGTLATLVLGACSQQAPTAPAVPSASAQAAANEAAAAKELVMYRQMLADRKNAFAAPIGDEIVQKYPGTAAAAEVGKTLPAIEAHLKATAEHDRLANLWYYQTADVQGLQHTASIYATGHDRGDQIRLVLRRHVKWGQSVYLFGNGKGFVCKGNCNVVMTFDGKRETWKGYLPPTGEPAMFIKNDKRFIAALAKTKVITMDVTTKAHGKQTLKFEVGGYDPARFLPLPKK
ncbi:MAG TPA: hypothetical protein VFL63_07870 [Rhodanobacteraceae bacterium]|nr:hypothetical protein [Rhodanobacteraceae bacterium]